MRKSTEEKIENEWRKITELLQKDLPQRMKEHVRDYRQLNYLKTEALNIQKQFKNKFGEDKHYEYKVKEDFKQWEKPVIRSKLGGF